MEKKVKIIILILVILVAIGLATHLFLTINRIFKVEMSRTLQDNEIPI